MANLTTELKEIESSLRQEMKDAGIDGRAWRHWDVDDEYAFDELFQDLEMSGFPEIDFQECLDSSQFIQVAHIRAVYNYSVGSGEHLVK